MSDLIDEIREDIKEERYAHAWKRYGNFIIGLAILIIIITAIGVWFNQHQQASNEKIASEFYAITYGANDGATQETLEQLDMLQYNQEGVFSDFAAFKRAVILKNSGQKEQANAVLKEIADDASVAVEFKSLANLLHVTAEVNADIKDIDADALNARLDDLIEGEAVWKFLAIEQKALLALRLGEREEAKELFESIANDFSAPVSLRNRAETVAQSLAS